MLVLVYALSLYSVSTVFHLLLNFLVAACLKLAQVNNASDRKIPLKSISQFKERLF